MSFRQTLPLLTQHSKSKSSKQWISRQFRDPYIKKRLTDPAAYRSRSAFKLLEINDQMGWFLEFNDVQTVVDLGAAPGGWSQVVAEKIGGDGVRTKAGQRLPGDSERREEDLCDRLEALDSPSCRQDKSVHLRSSVRHLRLDSERVKRPVDHGTIVAVDLLPIDPIPGVHVVRGDFLLGTTTERIRNLLVSKDNPNGKADVILSDMAGNISGNTAHDTESSLEICESVFEFMRLNLRSAHTIGRRKGGVLLVKFFAHPLLDQFRKEKLEPNFHYVRYIKPDSSRKTSREGYFFCQGWAPR